MSVRVLGIAVLSVVVTLAQAGPDTITYQGSVLDSLGRPVPDGTYRMQFKLYDGQSWGRNRWQQTANVEVVGGLFSVTLGESTPLYPVFMACSDLWLEVTVDVDQSGTFEPSEVFQPKQQIHGSPWACPRVGPEEGSPNLIGGHPGNSATTGVIGAVISGGGFQGETNRVGADFGAIGGGVENQARYAAFVGGGVLNSANGSYATVPGGLASQANGQYSFAAGYMARANHRGAFVWADSSLGKFSSERVNQFRVRANGGVRFDVNDNDWVSIRRYVPDPQPARLIDTSVGAHLTAGGTWQNGSDRAKKENFEAVDGRDVLARVAQLPITTWNYRAEGPSTRRMGPTAQDFHAAFGLGGDDTSIGAVDADGVSLAAIQGLYQLVREKESEIAAQRQLIEELRARVVALEARAAAPRTK